MCCTSQLTWGQERHGQRGHVNWLWTSIDRRKSGSRLRHGISVDFSQTYHRHPLTPSIKVRSLDNRSGSRQRWASSGWLPVEIWYEFDILNGSRFPSAGMPNPYHTNFKWKGHFRRYQSARFENEVRTLLSTNAFQTFQCHVESINGIWTEANNFGSANPGIEVSQCLTAFDDIKSRRAHWIDLSGSFTHFTIHEEPTRPLEKLLVTFAFEETETDELQAAENFLRRCL